MITSSILNYLWWEILTCLQLADSWKISQLKRALIEKQIETFIRLVLFNNNYNECQKKKRK